MWALPQPTKRSHAGLMFSLPPSPPHKEDWCLVCHLPHPTTRSDVGLMFSLPPSPPHKEVWCRTLYILCMCRRERNRQKWNVYRMKLWYTLHATQVHSSVFIQMVHLRNGPCKVSEYFVELYWHVSFCPPIGTEWTAIPSESCLSQVAWIEMPYNEPIEHL